jgi:hypothetical protein
MFLDRPTKIFAAEKIILMLLEKYCMFLFTIFEKEKIYYPSTYPTYSYCKSENSKQTIYLSMA